MAKFVNIQIPLIEISSDSESGSSAPPPTSVPASPPVPVPGSPAASLPRSCSRTPRRHPTVSDDRSSEAPARVPSISRHDPSPPAFRAPVPAPRPHPPRVPGPIPPYERPQPPAPRAPYMARMTTAPLLPHQLIRTNFPGPFPHSTHEHGESSRQANHDRRVDRLAAEAQDARYSCQRLREAQESTQRRVAAFETVMTRWRHAVDTQARVMTGRVQQVQLEYLQRTARIELVVTRAIALGLAVLAAFVAFMPWFYPRR